MDKETRNKLRNTVVQCRKLLEEDILGQLEGTFGIHRNGRIEPEDALPNLDAAGLEARNRAVAAIEHIQGYGMKPADVVDQFQREVAFTHLNRLCAFKMLERRGLLEETVSRGTNSNGFKVYLAAHPEDERLWQTGREYEAYKRFLFDVCARLSIEIRVLFDTEHVSSHLFPGQRALNGVLDLINAKELADIWDSDETIGWIYQYFTPKELREKARKESAAPRNSYELAFRNQFYTPRYVVQFLTDNTLGRIWYEMRKGETRLVDECQYMVRRKRPVFMAPGEKEPEPFGPSDDRGDADLPGEMWVRPNPDAEDVGDIFRYALTIDGYAYAKEHLGVECGDLANERLSRYQATKKWEGTFEELRCCLFFEQRRYHHFGQEPDGEALAAIKALHRAICDRWNLEAEYIPHRDKKLPWEIRVLDPASGSGHFLLYAFDLLETIYDEAYNDPQIGPDVQKRYPDREAYRVAVPALILRHNLHGIDIDLRSVQIASLALWMRAQRSYQRLGVNGDGRPRIEKANIVCAEPMPGDEALLEEFCDSLSPSVLGDLVRAVWQKMQLAGEAGSLLKIEEEIRDVVRRAQEGWRKAPKGYKISLFDGSVQRPAEQVEFDFSDVTGAEFWEKAEERLLSALEAFAEHATNGKAYGRRLFAEDAKQGFDFIDLCRWRYDVVLMNPPFGESSVSLKKHLEKVATRSKHDLACAFVETWLERCTPQGRLGAITTRTPLFLATSKRWREEIILPSLRTLADLGQGVLEAMVETAAFVLGASDAAGACVVFRVVETEDKGGALGQLLCRMEAQDVFLVETRLFCSIPNSPLCYWLPEPVFLIFRNYPQVGDSFRARSGSVTFDDFRFLRALWEMPPSSRWLFGKPRWHVISKGGEFSPYYADIHLLIDWKDDGDHVAACVYEHRPREGYGWGPRGRNIEFFGKPSVTWSRRSQKGFSARVLPAGCVFSDKSPVAQHDIVDCLWFFLAISNSSLFRALVRAQIAFGSYEVGAIERTPFPRARDQTLTALAKESYLRRRDLDRTSETSHAFVLPHIARERQAPTLVASADAGRRLVAGETTRLASIQAQIDDLAYSAFDMPREGDVVVDIVEGDSQDSDTSPDQCDGEAENDEGPSRLAPPALVGDLLSYAVGCAFGLWDTRICADASLAPALAEPFDPVPVCPPGTLVGPDGLPARSGGIVSEEWLRARPDAITLPPEGTVSRPTIAGSEYPLRVDWDGILADDPDHPDDIVRRVREVLELLWKERATAIEQEACEILGVKSLREYFRNPKHFWEDHVKRYSKSRRKAPIYWLLQSRNRHYALCLYYHRLDEDILFKALRNYVDPKCRLEESRLKGLRSPLASTAEGRERKALEKEIDDQEGVLNDVLDFKERLEKVANLGLEPDLDDGVILNIAPLWELVPWKEPKQYWDELVAGKYEWSSIGKQLRQKGLVRGQGK